MCTNSFKYTEFVYDIVYPTNYVRYYIMYAPYDRSCRVYHATGELYVIVERYVYCNILNVVLAYFMSNETNQ